MRTLRRARNRQDQPVRGIYSRDGKLYAGFRLNGKWTLRQLKARSTDEAIVERTKLVRRLGGYLPREPEPEPKRKELDQIYSDARRLAQQVSLARPVVGSGTGRILGEAEGLIGRATDLLFEAWRRSL